MITWPVVQLWWLTERVIVDEHIQMAPGKSWSFVEMCGFGIESGRQGKVLWGLSHSKHGSYGYLTPQRGLGTCYHERRSTFTWSASVGFCTISTSVASAVSILGMSAIPGLLHVRLDHSLCHRFLKFPSSFVSGKLSSLAGSLSPHKVSMEITSYCNVSNKQSLKLWCFSQM